jgi:hypothetical protein
VQEVNLPVESVHFQLELLGGVGLVEDDLVGGEDEAG